MQFQPRSRGGLCFLVKKLQKAPLATQQASAAIRPTIGTKAKESCTFCPSGISLYLYVSIGLQESRQLFLVGQAAMRDATSLYIE
jgi:hypothetical protein